MMSVADDPDANFINVVSVGVPTGVGIRMPRTPAVYGRKRKWALDKQRDAEAWRSPWEAAPWRDNYSSAKEEEVEVQRQFDEMVEAKKAIRLSPIELKRRWPDAAVASLGTLVKTLPDGTRKVRILYDGTYGVNVNPRIRVRDQDRGPCTVDVKRLLRAQSVRRNATIGLTVDVRDAHRLVPVREADWKYQVCRAKEGGDLYAFCCGLFGIASAAYWWGRLAGAIVRTVHYMATPSMQLWLLLVADDLKIESTASDQIRPLLFTLWLLEILGVPLQWNKAEGGCKLNWVGYEFSYISHSLGLSSSRAAWAAAWCERLAQAGSFRMSDFREGLGRLGFVVGALSFDAPFLAPLYAHVATCGSNRVRILPAFVRLTLAFLAERFKWRRAYSCAHRGAATLLGPRVDAMAEQERIGIGGWLPQRDEAGSISTAASPWFSITLDRDSARWAFTRAGQPYRVISALEAFGTLLAIKVFSPWLEGVKQGALTLKAFTDNKGNTFALNRLATTKFPLNVVVMELATILESLNLHLDLNWVPRELNEEADRLSKGVHDGFTPSNRVQLSPEDVKWERLNQLMTLGETFYAENQRLRDHNRGALVSTAKRRRGNKLRDREPW